MGEQDRAVHEISDSRARLSELATELSRRVDKEHVKEFATEKATELKERAREFATEKADELKQHAKDVATEKAIEMKDNAREAVMTKTTELKERADTPKGWSLLGAIIGAGVGSALMRKAFSVREERYESELYGRDTYRRGAYGEDWRYDAYGRRDLGGYGMRGEIDRSDISSPARVGDVGDTTQGLSMSGDVGFEGREIQGADQGSGAGSGAGSNSATGTVTSTSRTGMSCGAGRTRCAARRRTGSTGRWRSSRCCSRWAESPWACSPRRCCR